MDIFKFEKLPNRSDRLCKRMSPNSKSLRKYLATAEKPATSMPPIGRFRFTFQKVNLSEDWVRSQDVSGPRVKYFQSYTPRETLKGRCLDFLSRLLCRLKGMVGKQGQSVTPLISSTNINCSYNVGDLPNNLYATSLMAPPCRKSLNITSLKARAVSGKYVTVV